MALLPGTRLGPYEVLGPLGAGGMGEVYRARDSRLGRDVAVKVLPQHLAATPESRQRFEREARAASALNHPHICVLHDIGREGDTDYLVMELVEGETLGHRLERGALPIDQVLRTAMEIADALDRAHRGGIVHRDLKPGNVMVTRSGAKLMDFGLARAMGLAPASGALSHTPTMTQPLTAEGAIVGTFQYMAPEQLEGKEADARTDLWALGCVIYEMATGRRAFEGASQASLISSIMKDEPRPLAEIAPMSPPALERVVLRCLAKDPEDRWQSARDVVHELTWIRDAGSQAGVVAAHATVAGRAASSRSRERLVWGAALAVVVLGAVALVVGMGGLRPRVEQGVNRFSIAAPENVTISSDPVLTVLSPDGRALAFVAADSSGVNRIWVRPLESIAPRPLAGTEDGGLPFWSPDSRTIAFFADTRLKKIPVAGGPPEVVCEAADGRGGSWGEDGIIVFAPGAASPLFRVPAGGGEPVQVTTLDSARHETGHRWPCFLPGGKRFLFVALPQRQGQYDVYAGSVDSKERRRILSAGGAPVYAVPGHLVYARGQSLVAQRFDARTLALHGEPVALGEAPPASGYDGAPRATASDNGMIAHVGSGLPDTELQWLDRAGRAIGEIPLPPGRYESMSFTADGNRLCVLRRTSASSSDLWLVDLDRPVPARFTFGPSQNSLPVWSPDGSRIAFASDRSGNWNLYLKATSGAGEETPLLVTNSLFKNISQWSPDGRVILYYEPGPETGWDLWQLPVDGDRKPVAYLRTPYDEGGGAISPDGRWMAYVSDESGRNEIYVQSYPTPGSKYQVSTGGSSVGTLFLQWGRGGQELIYLAADGATLMAVDVTTGSQFRSGAPRRLFKLRQDNTGFAVTPDGRRVLVAAPAGEASRTTVTLVQNWTAMLKR